MNNIESVMKILKKESSNFKVPIVIRVSEKKDPFLVLISCILSLRTRDETTAKASKQLFAKAKTPKSMAKLSTNQIEKAIYPTGFYKTKAKRIKEIARLVAKNGMPLTFDELMKLKGVGRKTANIVVVYGYNKQGLPIDTHCHRIPNRLGWIKTKTPEQTEAALRELLPKKYWHDFNDILVKFGQNICKPIGPLCTECPVNHYCKYYKTSFRPHTNK